MPTSMGKEAAFVVKNEVLCTMVACYFNAHTTPVVVLGQALFQCEGVAALQALVPRVGIVIPALAGGLRFGM